jgi:hypothetical protein
MSKLYDENVFSYYQESNSKNLITVDKETLLNLLMIKDAYINLEKNYNVKVTKDLLDVNDIAIVESNNIAQAYGNDQSIINEYMNLFATRTYNPFYAFPPVVVSTKHMKNILVLYATLGGFKRIKALKRAVEKGLCENKMIPVIKVDIEETDERVIREIELKINSVENAEDSVKKIEKTTRDIDSIANSVNAYIREVKLLNPKDDNIPESVYRDCLSIFEYDLQKSKYSLPDIITRCRRNVGCKVPVLKSTSEMTDLARNSSNVEDYCRENGFKKPLIVAYNKKNGAISNKDLPLKYLNSKLKAEKENYDAIFCIVQHTGVTSKVANEHKKKYLNYENSQESTSNNFKQVANSNVPVIMGVCLDDEITLQSENYNAE